MSETTSYDNLIAGTEKNLVTRAATVRMGEAFSRGALLGRLTATGKWQTIDEDNASGCNEFGIATEAIDSTAGEVSTVLYVEGEFSENGVIFGYSDTADDWRETLMAHGIYLRKTVSVLGQ